ncbi:MAG TPA: hypothetical protein G4N98_08205 [Thermoflexia bacterium]|nr:hypothetical protein [Thermoflexia bacterium]
MLGVLDVFMILLWLAVVIWGLSRQTIGTLISGGGFYLALILAGTLDLTISRAHSFGMKTVLALWGTTRSIRLLEVIIFSMVSGGVFVIYHLIFYLAQEERSYPEFGIIDNILGGVLGALLGLVMVALFANLWWLAASVPWSPYNLQQGMLASYQASLLAPQLRGVLRIFNRTLLPFFFYQHPPVFFP